MTETGSKQVSEELNKDIQKDIRDIKAAVLRLIKLCRYPLDAQQNSERDK